MVNCNKLVTLYVACFPIITVASLMTMFKTLLGSPPCYALKFMQPEHLRVNSQQANVSRVCQVFLCLPTRSVPSTTNLLHDVTLSASPFHSTCSCDASLHFLITSSIASTPIPLSYVLVWLSLMDTLHIYLITPLHLYELSQQACCKHSLTNDHPHQRPSLSYDHISCDGQWFLFVYESLTSDHPSYTTTPM